jgi:branched-chain amino acid transport system substrate-binding protein
VIAALAAEAAQSDDPDHLAAQIVDVTQGGDTCTTFQECRRLLADGADIAYAGLGGSYRMDANGDPTQSVFTVLQYGADNLLDPNRTEYVVASSN